MNTQSDIAADFLVEAGEIAEQLGEQLVDLEHRANDVELLNAIFRGFHTIKGGAGFLHLTPMIDICHIAEELFDSVRSGKRAVESELMDLALRALDEVQRMMGELKAGSQMTPAPQDLLDGLRAIAGHMPAQPSKPEPSTVQASQEFLSASGDITDDEFESLLDALQGSATSSPVSEPVPPAPQAEPAKPVVAPKANAMPKPAEDAGKNANAAKEAEPTVRVEIKRLDALMNLVGELVLARNRLKSLRRRAQDGDIERAIGGLDLLTARLQSAVMKTRMQPIGRVFSRFPKVARDVARALKKDVKLELIGEETEIDKNIVESLSDPLVHLVRNAVDHGIESPERRERDGKSRTGTVQLSAQHEGDHILIIIRDDGAGMDPEVLRNKAREKGLISHEAAARLTHEECLQLIFLPGFSTKSEVSDISGRGVGMDVVMTRLKELNGQVSIFSQRGQGSTITIRLPLTLAILTTLMVGCCGRPYAIGLSAVDEVFRYEPADLLWIDGREVLDVRGSSVPLMFLSRWLGKEPNPTDSCVVLLRSGELRFGLVVDVVKGRDEVVVKPLPVSMRKLAGFSGATITGDGAIALILDPYGLYRAGRNF
jgi:two-component system chemotaxis sensor kinase CheA